MSMAHPSGHTKRANPRRSCIGCRKQSGQDDLLRLVRSPEGEVLLDHPRRLGGRGAYVCNSLHCFRKALRPSLLGKTLGGRVKTPEFVDFIDRVRERISRRVEGLFAAAGRARKVSIGAAETEAALRQGKAKLIVLAEDVSPRVRRSLVEAAERANVRVGEFGDKSRLGFALARSEVGAVALSDPGFAATVHHELELLDGLSTTEGRTENPSNGDGALERAT